MEDVRTQSPTRPRRACAAAMVTAAVPVGGDAHRGRAVPDGLMTTRVRVSQQRRTLRRSAGGFVSSMHSGDFGHAMASVAAVRGIAEASGNVLVTLMRLDGDLTIAWRSQPGAEAILGLDPHHGVGGPAWEWLPRQGRTAFRRQTETLLSGTTSRAVRHAVCRPDRDLVDVVTTAWRANDSYIVAVTVPGP